MSSVSLVTLGPLIEASADARGAIPPRSNRRNVMKIKELNAARRLITKVLAQPSLKPDQRDELRKAKRELDKIAGSGKLERKRIFVVTEKISLILLEVVEGQDPTR